MEKTLNFEFKKETPGTFVYQEIVSEDEELSVPTVYIKKGVFENDNPAKLQLVLKVEE